jgi:hypothetical protein
MWKFLKVCFSDGTSFLRHCMEFRNIIGRRKKRSREPLTLPSAFFFQSALNLSLVDGETMICKPMHLEV